MTGNGFQEVDPFIMEFLMPPMAQQRARITRQGHAYTPNKTAQAQHFIRETWQAHGRLRVPDGPLQVAIVSFFTRPESHFRKSGELNAIGEAAIPGGTRDWDNLGKLVCDALNGLAWKDDRLIVDGRSIKAWAAPSTPARVFIRAKPMPAPGGVR